MKTSEQIDQLATALAKAQSEIEGASRDCANPFFKSRYADLASVWDACRGPLTKNGLSVVQLPSTAEAVVTVTTTLLHSSGQWISGELSASAKAPDPQSVGSAITYLRRYALQSIAGVAPEDDDGNAASQPQKSVQRNGKHDQPQPLKSEQFKEFALELDTMVGEGKRFKTRSEAWAEAVLTAGKDFTAETLRACTDKEVFASILKTLTEKQPTSV